MRSWCALFAAVAVVVAACGGAGESTVDTGPSSTSPATSASTPVPATTQPAGEGFDAAIAAMVPSGSPGVIVRVDIGGNTVLETAVGEVALGSGRPLTAQHPFRIGSTTKPITAATVLRLHEQGQLDIDDPIADYLPPDLVAELHVADDISRGGDITIRHLLSHTSGLADRSTDAPFVEEVLDDSGRVWKPRELVEYGIAHSGPLFEPGSDFHYSDDGYVLLGMIIEAASELPLHEAYRQQVFDPLGMDDTYLGGQEAARGLELSHPYWGDIDGLTIHPSVGWGGGGLVSTVADLARFGAALTDGTLFEHATTIDEMMRDPGTGYGLGIFITSVGPLRTRMLFHDGFWGSYLAIVPEFDMVVVATTNQFLEEETERLNFLSDVFDLALYLEALTTEPSG